MTYDIIFLINTGDLIKMKDYIDRITELRIDNDIKQELIAKMLNTNQSNYSKIEKRKLRLSIEQLMTLCQYYKVSADYILFG